MSTLQSFTPVRKKLLTRPVLKWEIDKPKYLLLEAPMHIGKTIKSRNTDEKQKEPATVVNVIDLTTGEPAQIIVNAILKSVLNEEYPNDGYVGLCFSVTKQARTPGKQYDPFKIEEIENPNDKKEPAPTAEKTSDPIPMRSGKR